MEVIAFTGSTINKYTYTDRSKVIEGVEVTKEITQSMTPSSAVSNSDSLLPTEVSSPSSQHSHIDFITDLSIVPYKNQQFIVSASHDGVLKLWK